MLAIGENFVESFETMQNYWLDPINKMISIKVDIVRKYGLMINSLTKHNLWPHNQA